MAPYEPSEVRIPYDVKWRNAAMNYDGVNPDLAFAGRLAFKAISEVWLSSSARDATQRLPAQPDPPPHFPYKTHTQVWMVMADPLAESFFKPGWCSEQLWRYAYESRGMRITSPSLANCKMDRAGGCRYFGQLALVARTDASLLLAHPEASQVLCKAASGPCNEGSELWPKLACAHSCSALGYCGASKPYLVNGTDCTGCKVAGHAAHGGRCPPICLECRDGGRHDGGVARSLMGEPNVAYAWPYPVIQEPEDAEIDRGWCMLLRAIGEARVCQRWGGRGAGDASAYLAYKGWGADYAADYGTTLSPPQEHQANMPNSTTRTSSPQEPKSWNGRPGRLMRPNRGAGRRVRARHGTRWESVES